MFIGFKNGHIGTDLREDEQGREFRNASNGGNTLDLGIIGPTSEKKLLFKFGDGAGNEIHVSLGVGEFKTLFAEDMIAADGVEDFVIGSLDAAMDEGKTFLFIKGFVGKQIVHDAGGGFAEGVSKDTIYPDPGNGHGVLVTVFLSGAHVRELKAISGKLSKSADVSGWNEGSFGNVKAEQFSYSFRIPFVGLFAFDGFHIFGVCQADIKVRFKDIKDRDPVFTGGFHADIVTALGEKPVAQGGDI